ncbi:MAG: NAD(P)-dependent oxidoreductase [Nitriliruptoraceae bacterium]
MRILFADMFPEPQRTALASAHDVHFAPDLVGPALAEAAGACDVLVVRSTKVDGSVLAAAPDLRLVIRAGSGVDTIDLEAAASQGVAVANVPGKNAIAVAELAWALLLAIDRRVVDQAVDLRDGRWRKSEYQRARGIAGRRVGVVGLGAIGLEFAARARAFECNLFAVNSSRSTDAQRRAEQLEFAFVDDLADLAATCDVLSFHIPLTSSTQGMIGQPLLSHVQPGSILINTARGELVDEQALLAALDEKDLHVGLDVHPAEPSSGEGTISNELIGHPRVIGTHHCGASTTQAQHAIADEVVAIIEAFAEGSLRNVVASADPSSS